MAEKFVRYSEDFPSLWAAWDFILERAGEFDLPTVDITPYEQLDRDMDVSGVVFTACVSGVARDEA